MHTLIRRQARPKMALQIDGRCSVFSIQVGRNLGVQEAL